MGDKTLAADLVEETSRFIDDVLWDAGGGVPDVLTSRYTFVNANLAKVYGLPAPAGGAWQKVMFDAASPRAGFLTQGSLMAAGSHNDKPSNTRRGQMVREQLLCQDVPSPPPGVDANVPPAQPGETEQQTFIRHTTVASCAACHTLMDPIGWGLSGFDAAGAVRTKDSNGQPLSLKGQVAGLSPPDFNGPVELGAEAGRVAGVQGVLRPAALPLRLRPRRDGGRRRRHHRAAGRLHDGEVGSGGGPHGARGSDGFRYRNKGDAP